MRLIYEKEKCVGCGNCVIVCPLNLSLEVRAKGGKGGNVVKVKDGTLEVEECPVCGLCVRFCPFNALKLEADTVKEFEKSIEIFEETKEKVEKKKKEVKKKVERYSLKSEFVKKIETYIDCLSTGLLRRVFEGRAEITRAEIKNLMDVFEKRGDVFGILEEQIIEKDLCSLCGACYSACPDDAIEIKDVPTLVGKCSNCAACIVRCPKTSLVKVEPNNEISVYLAKGKFGDEKRHGVIKSLLAYALDKGIVDCVIYSDGEKPVLSTKSDELENVSEKFSISPNVAMLKKAVKSGLKSMGVVGSPCSVLAFRKFQMLGFDGIKFIIGVFCPRGSYKGKVPLACKLCTDFFAEFSDISVSHTSENGWAIVITRSDVGEELIKSASREGYVRVGDAGDLIEKYRKFASKKVETGKKNRDELLKKFSNFEDAVNQLGALNVRYLSGGKVW